MTKRVALCLLLSFQIFLLRAQTVPDSSRAPERMSADSAVRDSVPVKRAVRKPVKVVVDTIVIYHTDSIRYSERKPSAPSYFPLTYLDLLKSQMHFNFLGKPMHVRSEHYERESYEGMFYLLVLMLFYFAIIKLFFAKYLGNLLTLFFRASMRQQQLREQVLQAPVPSFLLNNLFIFSGGLYAAFLLRYYHFGNSRNFWIYFLYGTAVLALLYLLKFLILKVAGWIFNISRTADNYLFVVFMTNKIIGMFLLPFLVVISFAGPALTDTAITLSFIMICVFYVYRIVASYNTLHKEINISGLHFFLYLCAFEIVPLLLIYKVLVNYLEKAY